MKETVKCTSCRIRSAIYYRKASGEKLCLECLERSIVKQVKKEINKWKMFSPHDSIGFLILNEAPLVSFSAYKILEIIERKYPSKLIPINIKDMLTRNNKVLKKPCNASRKPVKWNTITELLRLERILAAEAVKNEGINKIVLPNTLEFESAYFLYCFLNFDLENIGELKPKLYSSYFNVEFVKPFRKIKTVDLLAYGYFKGLYNERIERSINLKNSDFCESLNYMYSISYDHQELIISTLKMSEVLLEYIVKEFSFKNHCIYCGIPVRNNVCKTCSKLIS